jgi:hypothetical protein
VQQQQQQRPAEFPAQHQNQYPGVEKDMRPQFEAVAMDS